ncbi:major histocompatibility complex class I-related gene protein-like isoform X2 [Conger conger]|nr:major histocompatibility complex class I-related gene protein-like isoform X2 [Conger conger]XP_061106828.1 major histocompatibility complex class I-related gene protein-like isoform X2 [Conger conger]XP_061106829.1 major histocompatibility complex class I-related gene protein-like isoform X2 [Conger conger]XP_061106830.1 major histocompatibility complex class I-related gene protein-like isoform X2 [Conger conger]
MVLLGMVDDILVEQYDSVSKKMSPQQDWQKEEDSVAYAEMKRIGIADITDSLKARLQYMREHFNHSVTLHTYQRFAGCELDDDGTERFKAQDAYNGKDVLSFDTQAATWSTPFPEMQKDSWVVQTYKGLSYHVYQSLCVRLLKSFLQQGGSILKRRVKPKIRVLQKQVGSAGAVEVTCLATGFYPRHIELTLQRDNQPVQEQELIRGDILPNCDGTYQQRMSLSVSAEELRVGHRYTCGVRHVSMDNKLDISWDPPQKPRIGLISGTVVTALIIVLSIIIIILIRKKRKNNVREKRRSEKTEEEIEEESAINVDGCEEMEKQED